MTNKEAVNWIINITADIGKAEHRSLWHYEQALTEIREMLEIKPERKTGHWIHHSNWESDGEFPCECSECGMGSYVDYSYCMRCGAHMLEGVDE